MATESPHPAPKGRVNRSRHHFGEAWSRSDLRVRTASPVSRSRANTQKETATADSSETAAGLSVPKKGITVHADTSGASKFLAHGLSEERKGKSASGNKRMNNKGIQRYIRFGIGESRCSQRHWERVRDSLKHQTVRCKN